MTRPARLRALRGLVVCAAAVVWCGCGSSLRYTTDSSGVKHYYVPSDWDYRKHYVIPQARLKKIVDSYIGTRYKSGGTSRKGLDCSGFVWIVFNELNHAKMPRSTGKLKSLGTWVSQGEARPGDLVFFRGGIFNMINHVGIYMGGRSFVHASTSSGVMYDTLDEDYYKKHFAMVRRVF
jgi:murein DD-endopeptidase / murein LD-carboxypeptidase